MSTCRTYTVYVDYCVGGNASPHILINDIRLRVLHINDIPINPNE